MIDINRSLSDDVFDNIVAKIADDGGFSYDEFSQGKPVVKLNTNKGILSQVQDDYYNPAICTEENLGMAKRQSRFYSSSGGGAGELFNFDNDYMNSNVIDEDHNESNIYPIQIYPNDIATGVGKKNISNNNKIDLHHSNNSSTKNSLKYSMSRRRTRSSSEGYQYNKSAAGCIPGADHFDDRKGYPSTGPKQMIGKLTKEERRKRIDRWLEKRKHRNWSR
jgi:hypothetical protein